MDDRSRIYMGAAFAAGVILALGLEPFWESKHDRRKSQQKASDSKSQRGEAPSARTGPPAIVDGIEGCIGNTPLFRIKSLSEATGCEILGKAEV